MTTWQRIALGALLLVATVPIAMANVSTFLIGLPAGILAGIGGALYLRSFRARTQKVT